MTLFNCPNCGQALTAEDADGDEAKCPSCSKTIAMHVVTVQNQPPELPSVKQSRYQTDTSVPRAGQRRVGGAKFWSCLTIGLSGPCILFLVIAVSWWWLEGLFKCQELGNRYYYGGHYNGKEIPIDYAEAARWYRKAAKRGFPGIVTFFTGKV